MKRNRIRICGRNTITAPTPLITPSTSSERSSESGISAVRNPCNAVKPASIASMNGCAQLNTAWNIRNMIASSRTGPATGCSATASSMCVQRRTVVSDTVAAVAIVRARRWSVTISSCTLPSDFRRRIGPLTTMLESAALSSSRPRLRTATVGITGTPSSRSSTLGSSFRPSRSARSTMLSATTTGRPSAISWSVKRR